MKAGIHSWKNLIKFVLYFFSIPQLLGSLISPWRADTFTSESTSAIERFFQNLFFKILTRIIGLIIRISLIVLGLIVLALTVVTFPLFLIIPLTLRYEKLVRVGSLGKTWSYPFTSFLNKHSKELRETSSRYFPQSREVVIEQINRTLARENQSNVILLAQQGVGKTSVVEEFAHRVHWGLVHKKTGYKRVVQLIADEMSADDVVQALRESVKAKNIILVIDNIHNNPKILGLLIPYFHVKDFQIIITTDFNFYHNTLKYNDELMQVASKVELAPPTSEETQNIIKEYISKLSRKITLEDGVLGDLVHYTDTLIQHIPQPEKSIDIIEELTATSNNITKEMLHNVISQKTNVPVGNITRDESQFLLTLEDKMKEKIIGQSEAVEQVTRALKRSRSGIGSIDKPMGVFLFMGPTGVGKTYTAQILAQLYFGSKQSMIRFDMSEFRELGMLGTFIARAADAIEAQPFSLFFVDEIEKAHPDILNIFLQIFDEGRLTMENGRTVSFNSSIIICTTNAGSILLQENPNMPQDRLIERIIEQGIFRPEFLNRFDAVVKYKPLDKEQVHQVTRLMLDSVIKRIKDQKNIEIILGESIIHQVAEAGFDPKFGARPIRRAAQEIVEDAVADKLLRGEVEVGGTLTLE